MIGPADPEETTIAVMAAAPPLLSASDNDAFFEYGYVWLPYAIAALALFALGAFAALRWRRSSPGTAELLITSGALLAVLAAMVLGLADGASEGNGLASIDPPVWQWMIDHRTPALTTIAIVVTTVGSTVSMTIIAAATIVYLLIKRRFGDAVLVAVVAAGAGLLVTFGKATVGRERPPAEFRLVTETNESFPSGHALASAAILGVVLVVLLPSISSRATRIAVLAGVVLFALSIGLSRLYLGVHWATDVIGGWVTGLAWLALCLTVRQVWRQTRGRPDLLVSEPGPPAIPPADGA
jgi:undecaprenyl-diphosphatase